jgi:hypothetical protein
MQGVDEVIGYALTVDPAASSVVAVKVFDMSADALDVTSTVMPTGSASISGSNIILPQLRALTVSHTYRVEVRYSDGTNTFEPYFLVSAEQ